MSARKSGLGKSLNALLGPQSQVSVVKKTNTPADGLAQLPVEFLQPGVYQPRKVMDDGALSELAESIKAQGIIQPIVVRKIAGDNRYEILAGERRWRAAQLAQLEKVPVVIRHIDDEAAMAIALIENIQREDLNPVETAFALQRLLDEFQLTHQEIATAVGKSRTTVTNMLRLLNLQESVRRLLENGDLEMGHARALLGLPADKQHQVATTVVEKGLTVRQTEQLIRSLLTSKPAKPQPKLDPNIARTQQTLAEKLGAKVAINHQSKGAGKLVIQYHSLDQLQGILEHMGVAESD